MANLPPERVTELVNLVFEHITGLEGSPSQKDGVRMAWYLGLNAAEQELVRFIVHTINNRISELGDKPS